MRTTLLVSLCLAIGSALAAPAASHQAVTRYVRYQQGGAVSWGALEGETIHQLSAAPYSGETRTGTSVAMGTTRRMEPGDFYEVDVEGVGALRNPVVQGR